MNLCAIGTGAITKSMLAEYQRSDVLHVTGSDCTNIHRISSLINSLGVFAGRNMIFLVKGIGKIVNGAITQL